jgi:membrane fusion protein, heavy metal efflux system
MRSRRTLIIDLFLILLILIPLAGCPQKGKSEKPEQAEKKSGGEKGSIVLTAEQMKTAGIVTHTLNYKTVEETIAITGELEAIPDESIKVTSRLSGKVSRILVQEGDTVKPGDPLVIMESVELAQADAAFHQAKAELDLASKNLTRVKDMARLGIFSRSTVEEARNAFAQAQAARKGAKAELMQVRKQYDRVKDLQSAGIVSTKDLEKAEADLEKASADEQSAIVSFTSAQDRLKREEESFKRGHLAYKEVMETEKAYDQALSHYRSAVSMLKILGVDENNHGRSYTLNSPIDGMVTALQITPGEGAVPTTPLMTIVNTDMLWLKADIYEKDLGKVRLNQKVTFTVNTYPLLKFKGRLSYISPMMDEKTRSVKARVQVRNIDKKLKVHMFARGFINVEHMREALLVPIEAIQQEGGKNIVYVLREKPGTFIPAEVEAGPVYEEKQEILKGLTAGQSIAVKGSFMIKSEERKSLLEED